MVPGPNYTQAWVYVAKLPAHFSLLYIMLQKGLQECAWLHVLFLMSLVKMRRFKGQLVSVTNQSQNDLNTSKNKIEANQEFTTNSH
jgi:hypothetical protein